MSRIVISLSGEGRGHTARTLTLLEMFADRHECIVLAPASVLDLLRPNLQRYSQVRLHLLPHLRFQYGLTGRLSYARSWMAAAPFIASLRSHVRRLAEFLVPLQPDLAITDFEPVLPRAALNLHLPLLSLDHQHFLAAIDTQALPLGLRLRALFLRPSIPLFCPSADIHLVSSFFQYPMRKTIERFQQVGVLLRRDFGRIPSRIGDHLLVYARRGPSMSWLPVLERCGLPVRVYGMHGSRDSYKNVQFCPISATQFLEDLSTCRALITTAGNQLVGEALAASKPVLAVPEPGNFEQQLNGYFLHKSGMGECIMPGRFSLGRLQGFLGKLDRYREQAACFDQIGNEAVRSAVESMLPHPTRTMDFQFTRPQGLAS